jgi:hypothetical protein
VRQEEADMKTFGVIRQGDVWIIVADGRRWGRFQYRVDAEEAALRLATRAATEGKAVSVVVQDAGGQIVPLKSGAGWETPETPEGAAAIRLLTGL